MGTVAADGAAVVHRADAFYVRSPGLAASSAQVGTAVGGGVETATLAGALSLLTHPNNSLPRR